MPPLPSISRSKQQQRHRLQTAPPSLLAYRWALLFLDSRQEKLEFSTSWGFSCNQFLHLFCRSQIHFFESISEKAYALLNRAALDFSSHKVLTIFPMPISSSFFSFPVGKINTNDLGISKQQTHFPDACTNEVSTQFQVCLDFVNADIAGQINLFRLVELGKQVQSKKGKIKRSPQKFEESDGPFGDEEMEALSL